MNLIPSSLLVGLAALGTVVTTVPTSTASADSGASVFPQVANPKVYIIPMKGQLGTDISKQIYEDVVKDVRKVKPDIIVYSMDSSDFDRTIFTGGSAKQRDESNRPDPAELRELALMLRVELKDLPQVMWVDDALGGTCLLALAWPDLFMTNRARLGGVGGIIPGVKKSWEDPDVQAKMVAAWAGIFKGLLQQGGYPEALGDAFLYPESFLSASFEGRKVKFLPDTTGQWVIDSRPDWAVSFTAPTAEDIGLSDGVADNLDDLMFILGYREYTKIESGEKLFTDYVEAWRKDFEKAWDNFEEAERLYGKGEAKFIGQAKTKLEDVVRAMKRYPAIEKRFQARGGPGILQLETIIESWKEQIKAAKPGTGRGAGGRGSGSSAPGGGPGSK